MWGSANKLTTVRSAYLPFEAITSPPRFYIKLPGKYLKFIFQRRKHLFITINSTNCRLERVGWASEWFLPKHHIAGNVVMKPFFMKRKSTLIQIL